MTAGEGQSLKKGLPGLDKLSKFRLEDAACRQYIPAGGKV